MKSYVTATARAYDLPLLTADETIAESELVHVIW
jgi:hypothetical protein